MEFASSSPFYEATLPLLFFFYYYTLFSCNVNRYHFSTSRLTPDRSPLSEPILSKIPDDEYGGSH
ncbi:hypothetical protein CGSSp9BS68_00452 [Streptococcus pneumoniae SP9-BS68]|nr:hypothetical protein CGSSp11BS70_02219 [Streptococcus pneumoniae SP11-BS70]EDK71429.1 hypothetical protein CGSSp19BS75_08857 [Streptococcus pneumoniae SP19-BS75]EDK74471.1 hypothetical protein CGSSp3BS71_02572 [Streptococcus pneumoniae SP3-BS71]EDK78004.1 hypothetical protein CGSSp9BS68_00452 [Streptococcus pneumoniae SP9-BS68]EDK81358.1 hypothetical protein CGSSp23BS72_00565 [Streptococcus pneumoniae SP23-BS72]EFL66704.1 hypothetical protein CGSSp14BS292_00667 [Streptococcus pneumoniae SP1